MATILLWYGNVYDIQVEPDVVFVLLDFAEAFFSLPRPIQGTIRFGTLIANRLILYDWKSTDPRSFSRWLREMVSEINLERLCCNSSTGISSVESDSIWAPITEHRNFLTG